MEESQRHFFFSLSDLWESFDEWSAYGAGVPIVLNGKETVTQYYVPYLSAIQLYTSEAISKSRKLGDDSDGSELDYRECVSEISSDCELEKILDCRSSSPLHEPWTVGAFREHSGGESLVFQYFETNGPALRVPLFDKVRELARQFPALKTLCSNDLSQSSWLSVAWYPIYRIPTGLTLQNLATCFLTFHSLSTLLADNRQETNARISQSSSFSPTKNQVSLHSFGLTSYKFRGAIWTSTGAVDRQRFTQLQRSSDNWLKQLNVQHPDFQYFMSDGLSARR